MTGRQVSPPRVPISSRAARWITGPEWPTRGLTQPGWVLLPLRAFLGVTFAYAGLQKLINPNFFNASSPSSVQYQMNALASTSPIGPLVRLSQHAGSFTGLLIALGELAVGIGTLLGLRARLAAVGGSLLALTFFLTVSWATSPYYYSADIVFLFAWTPFIGIGAAGVLSVDAWLGQRARADSSKALRLGADVGGAREVARQRERRAILAVGVGTAIVGGMAALIGRSADVAPSALQAPLRTPGTRPPTSKHHAETSHPGSTSKSSSPPGPTGTSIGSTRAVPIGQASQFTDPADGAPAWVVCLSRGKYAAFSAVCTHAGCTVEYAGSTMEFVCPCHGGIYSARTGQVLGGPPPSPLPSIPVQVTGGQIYVT